MQFICLISKRANGTVSGAMATWIYTQHPCFHAAAIHALHCFTQSLSIFQLPFRIFSGTMLPVIIFSQSLPSISSSHPLPIGLSTEEFRCFHVATYRYTQRECCAVEFLLVVAYCKLSSNSTTVFLNVHHLTVGVYRIVYICMLPHGNI